MKNILIGGVFFLGGILLMLGSNGLYAGPIREEKQSFSMTGLGSLIVSYPSARLTLRLVEGEDLVITERLRNADPATVSAEGAALRVSGNNRRWYSPSGKVEALIGIPENFRGDCLVKTGSGSLTLEGSLESGGLIELSSSSGSLNLDRLRAAGIVLSSSSGSVNAEELSGNTDIRVSSGRIFIRRLEGERHSIHSSSGSVDVNALTGTAKIRASAGSVNLGVRELLGDLSFDIASGSLNVRLPRNAGFNLDAETSSGSITVSSPAGSFHIKNRSSVLRPVGENPAYTIFARLGSGNLDISGE
ncbi:MAG: DUF4097 domain-containing protein [Treponema sp.]|jgi:lia operon protein LiaG|nr:DUF4097 domain-containing protein [Treponema sp.]